MNTKLRKELQTVYKNVNFDANVGKLQKLLESRQKKKVLPVKKSISVDTFVKSSSKSVVEQSTQLKSQLENFNYNKYEQLLKQINSI